MNKLSAVGGILVGLHKASFVVWLAATAAHVLGHLRELPRLLGAGLRVPRTVRRNLLLATALVAGTVLAAVTVRYGQPWAHWLAGNGRGDG